MKKILTILSLAFLIACGEDDDNNDNPSGNNLNNTSNIQATTNSLVANNGLIISLFTDDQIDETALFNGFVFNFDSNGNVVATSAVHTISGTYSIDLDDGKTEFEMEFPDTLSFNELDDDWYFVSRTDSTIRFDEEGDILEFKEL